MKLPLLQVDAFTDRPFGGNPAAVCALESWLGDEVLQNIAAENNLSETAFYVESADHFELRWFTPVAEVDLCGHATLAAAHALFEERPGANELAFDTRSGRLIVRRDGPRLTMDFPAQPATPCEPPQALLNGLGVRPEAVLVAADHLVVLRTEAEVRNLRPAMDHFRQLGSRGVIVSAPGETTDFVSRFFAPQFGIDEDPVTGSAHCTLAPYWAGRLGCNPLRARQLSPRGGELTCEVRGDRVLLTGSAVTVLRGELSF